jgi:pyruvate dehydrogenase E2 component (dihydrolipoyllysine-residue acetyltransferase)
MATDVMMPRLSDSMEEGTVLKWLVEVGGEVKRGEPLVEIETDKANMTYEADTDGVLIEVVAEEGETLPIGQVIARIGAAGEEVSGAGSRVSGNGAEAETEETSEETQQEPDQEPEPEREQPEAEEQPAEEPDTRRPEPETQGGNGRVKASPVARRMAREMGLELAGISGTGPGGRIVKADIEAAAKGGGTAVKERPAEERQAEPEAPDTRHPAPDIQADGAKGQVETQELTRLQRTVSRRMAESKATAPDFHLHVEIDMTGCVELRARLKEVADPAPSFNDMVVKACANALREFPRVNGAYRDGQWELYSRVNIGVAVAAQDTLIVPTVFDADQKSLGVIARETRGLIEKVRDGKITPPELSGGTFTVSNLGMYGIDSFSAVINPPQAAIMAVGALKKKPVVDESGRIVARDMMNVGLICDHRILYGADGAEFVAKVRQLLEQPLSLAL